MISKSILFIACIMAAVVFRAGNKEISPSGDAWIYKSTTNHFHFGPSVFAIETNAEDIVKFSRENGQLTNLVNLLVTSGEFCRVRGHAWCLGGSMSLNVQTRECAVCGRGDSRSMPAWREP